MSEVMSEQLHLRGVSVTNVLIDTADRPVVGVGFGPVRPATGALRNNQSYTECTTRHLRTSEGSRDLSPSNDRAARACHRSVLRTVRRSARQHHRSPLSDS